MRKRKNRAALLGCATALAGLTGSLPAQAQQAPASTDAPASRSLPGVSVTAPAERRGDLPAPYAGGQVSKGAPVGILGTQEIMDTPFSITSYTQELIENQQARSVGDVLANDPAVRMASPPGGQYQDFTVRGFYQDTMSINGLQGLSFYDSMPTEMIERVDIIKGPTSLVAGMSPSGRVGALINLQTKRAGNEPLTRLGVDYATESQLGGRIDIGRRFGQSKSFGARVNAVYRDGDTPMDGHGRRLALGSAGLDYRGDRLRASLDLLTQRGATKGFPRYINFTGTTVPDAPSAGVNPFYGSRYTAHSSLGLGRIEYDLAPNNWTLYATGGRGRSRSTFIGVNAIPGAQPNGNFSAPVQTGLNSKDGAAAEIGLQGRFRTGPVSHQLALAASYARTWTGSNYVNGGTTVVSNLYNPVYMDFPDTLPNNIWTSNRTTMNGLAVSDTLGLFDEHVLLTLGARRQQVRTENFNAAGTRTGNYDDAVVTPLLGVVFKVRPDVSLYANYIEGLTAGSVITDTTAANYGASMPPYRSKQVEAGVKWDLGKVTNTLSVFQIRKPSLIKDPVSTVYSADGDQRNRGVEWQVFGEPWRGLRLLAGASYTQAKIMRSAGGTFDGLDAFGVARKQATLGGEWDVPMLPGLSLNARVTYTGGLPVDNANRQRIPGWTRYDAGARYVARLGDGGPVTFRLNVENLLNKGYWIGQTFNSGYMIRSAPRTILLSATKDF